MNSFSSAYTKGEDSIPAAADFSLLRLRRRFLESRGPGGDWISFSLLAGKAFLCGTCTIMVEWRNKLYVWSGIAFSSLPVVGGSSGVRESGFSGDE